MQDSLDSSLFENEDADIAPFTCDCCRSRVEAVSQTKHNQWVCDDCHDRNTNWEE